VTFARRGSFDPEAEETREEEDRTRGVCNTGQDPGEAGLRLQPRARRTCNARFRPGHPIHEKDLIKKEVLRRHHQSSTSAAVAKSQLARQHKQQQQQHQQQQQRQHQQQQQERCMNSRQSERSTCPLGDWRAVASTPWRSDRGTVTFCTVAGACLRGRLH